MQRELITSKIAKNSAIKTIKKIPLTKGRPSSLPSFTVLGKHYSSRLHRSISTFSWMPYSHMTTSLASIVDRTLDEPKLDNARTTSSLSGRIWNYFVNLTALFLAQVLEHPTVVNAAARIMVAGIDESMEQPELALKIAQVTRSIATSEDGVKEIGKAFPKMALDFMGGAVAGIRGDSNRQGKEVLKDKET
jgi:hypothetical protein